jgi:hypothetical protein
MMAGRRRTNAGRRTTTAGLRTTTRLRTIGPLMTICAFSMTAPPDPPATALPKELEGNACAALMLTTIPAAKAAVLTRDLKFITKPPKLNDLRKRAQVPRSSNPFD